MWLQSKNYGEFQYPVKLTFHDISPFCRDKNLGRAYNRDMALLPENSIAIIRDNDTCFLTPKTRAIIEDYATDYPNALLTGYTNRLSNLNRTQLYNDGVSSETDIMHHIKIAEELEAKPRSVTPITKDISGFLMVLPKAIWTRYPFPETGQCLGIDTTYGRVLRAHQVPVLRMNNVYMFHIYRLSKGVSDKSHLAA